MYKNPRPDDYCSKQIVFSMSIYSYYIKLYLVCWGFFSENTFYMSENSCWKDQELCNTELCAISLIVKLFFTIPVFRIVCCFPWFPQHQISPMNCHRLPQMYFQWLSQSKSAQQFTSARFSSSKRTQKKRKYHLVIVVWLWWLKHVWTCQSGIVHAKWLTTHFCDVTLDMFSALYSL